MQKRNTQQRRKAIVDWINQHGFTPVEELSEHFSTSAVTIRKDLAVLSEQQLVVRQHGGAMAMPATSVTASPTTVNTVKAAIGKLATSLVQPNQKLIIDSGSTTNTMIPHLAEQNGLVVMTNSLSVANQLVSFANEPTVIMTGGTWDPQSQSFQGSMAARVVSEYSFDLAFVGAAGLDVNRGSTTYSEHSLLSQVMVTVATRMVVVAESAKLKHKMPNSELAWNDISVLVTDSNMPSETVKIIQQQGVEVMIAPLDGD